MSNAAQAKDPSMDDILSSIRQIISEEEVTESPVEEAVAAPSPEPIVMPEPPVAAPEPAAEIAPEPVAEAAPEPVVEAAPEPAAAAEIAMPDIEPAPEPSISDAVADMPDLDAPLELSSADVLPATEETADTDIAKIEAEINDVDSEPVVGGDIAFDEPNDPLVVSDDAEMAGEVESNSPLSLDIVDPDDVSFDDDDVSFADTDGDSAKGITMPDTGVRDEMVEDLLSPATEAIASAAFSNLSALSLSTDPGTIEDLIRAMLRPMLKSWLDDNLPTMVERLVQDEIERVSRR